MDCIKSKSKALKMFCVLQKCKIQKKSERETRLKILLTDVSLRNFCSALVTIKILFSLDPDRPVRSQALIVSQLGKLFVSFRLSSLLHF